MRVSILFMFVLLMFSQNACASVKSKDNSTGNEKKYEVKLIKKNGYVSIDMSKLPDINKIKGMDLIKDADLRNQVAGFLTADARSDYKDKYKYVSKEFLKTFFPKVKNGEDYKNEFKDSEDMGAYYTQILWCKKISDAKYKIRVEYETMAEGYLLRNKVSYDFINENGIWKYNGQYADDFESDELEY